MLNLSRPTGAFIRGRALLAGLVLVSLCCPVFARGKKPPTLDPSYGMPLPRKAAAGPEANWIWTSLVKEQQTIYLRGNLELKPVPEKAVLYITGDDFWTVYVNGTRLDGTEPNPKDNYQWQKVHRLDVARYLTAGKNVVAVRATNAGYAAGVVARLEIGGKPVLLSDASWKVSEDTSLPDTWAATAYDDSGWSAATVIGPLSEPNWSGQLTGWPTNGNECPYLYHLTIRPVAVLDVKPGKGSLKGLDTLTGKGQMRLVVEPAPADSKEQPSFVLDFGRELTGRVVVESEGPATVLVGTGESFDEAVEAPWGGMRPLDVGTDKKGATPYSAFRYARVSFVPTPGASSVQTVTSITLDHLYYPVEYKGSFSCSDPLLTKIWYTGTHTAHMCMQEEIWDAPKRDRWHWMGDQAVCGEVINNAFLDKFLMERTLSTLRLEAQGGLPETELPRAHINGIPGYSCAWVVGLADFHRHFGDYDYLARQHDLVISMLEFFRGELDDRGVFANNRKSWTFVDWAPEFNGDTPLARAATHMFMVTAVRDGAFLLGEMGDKAAAAKYSGWAEELAAAGRKYLSDPATGTYSDRRQENAMAVYSGVATPEQTKTIYDTILHPGSPAWDKVATPYYNNYVIHAMSMAGHTPETIGLIRTYWGGMIAQGATSFWEGYDPKWPKVKWHANLQADNGMGYFVSLCHGWSAGVTSWLTQWVLGVRPTSGGFKTAEIVPELGDLKWAEGDVPTPNGQIHVRAEKSRGGLKLQIKLPAGVDALVGCPGTKAAVNGKAVDAVRTDAGRVYIRLASAGKYTVTAE